MSIATRVRSLYKRITVKATANRTATLLITSAVVIAAASAGAYGMSGRHVANTADPNLDTSLTNLTHNPESEDETQQSTITGQRQTDQTGTDTKSDQKASSKATNSSSSTNAAGNNSQTGSQSKTASAGTPQAKAPASGPTSSYKQPTVAMTIVSATISTSGRACVDGEVRSGYQYNLQFPNNHTGGQVSYTWEYRQIPGQGLPREPIMPSSASLQVPAGPYSMSDTVSPAYGLMSFGIQSYEARLRVSGPNTVYSNWVTVPAISCSQL